VSVSAATVWRILSRHGHITPEPKKRPKSSYIRFEADFPNQMWQTDFTHYRLATGQDVEILNFLDDHSRYLLAAVAYPRVTGAAVVDTFRANR
jgi:transposase InsO family protein